MRADPVVCAPGYRVEWHNELDSTNSAALRTALDSVPSRLWIAAAQQTAGRGRAGRPWVSRPGNLYASLLLINEFDPGRAPELGFVTGVALAEALASQLSPSASPKLKWPNDVLCNGKKIAGILLEGSQMPGGAFACVIGCGVNCVSHPDNTGYPATNLRELGADVAAQDLLILIAGRFAHWFETWCKPDGFTHVRESWLGRAAHLGQEINVAVHGGSVRGRFDTLDEYGRLVLHTSQGSQVINTGDVMLETPAAGALADRFAGS